jgi:hypothetical protein
MRRSRWPRLVGIGLVLGAVMAVTSVVGSPSAGAKASAPGAIRCSGVTGIIRFSPPLAVTAAASTMKGSLQLSDCIVGSDSVRRSEAAVGGIRVGSSKASVNATLSCSDLTGETAFFPATTPWTTNWSTLKGTAPTVATFSGFVSTPGPDLSYPGPDSGVSATGSYTGNDGGTSSFVNLVYGFQPDACGPGGPHLKVLKITSGSFFSG